MTKASQRLGKQWETCFFLTKASASAGMISFVFDDAFMPSDPSYVPNVLFIPHVFSGFSFSADLPPAILHLAWCIQSS